MEAILRKIQRHLLFLARKKADFLIIGAQKAATTSLHAFLAEHPGCLGYEGKEACYFCLLNNEAEIDERYYLSLILTGEKKFSFNSLFFESSTDYTHYPGTAAIIHAYNPDIKLIFMVRNPIDRAYSEYNMHYQWMSTTGKEYQWSIMDRRLLWDLKDFTLHDYFCHLVQFEDKKQYPFSYWCDQELEKIEACGSVEIGSFRFPEYLRRGVYYQYLEEYYRYFRRDQILVIESSELKENKKETLNKVESFLGLKHIDWSQVTLEDQNTRIYNEKLPDTLRKRLCEFYAPHNERLFRLLERRFDWK